MESEALLDTRSIAELVEDLKALAEIVDRSEERYRVIMLSGEILNEAAQVIVKLQQQLLNHTTYF